MNVLKGADFQQKFHSQGTGAILIVTKRNKDSKAVQVFNKKYNITYKAADPAVQKLTAAVSNGNGLSESDLQERLLIVDGEEAATAATIIPKGQLASVYVLDAEKATAKFGARGSKGAVVIMTREWMKTHGSAANASNTELHLPTAGLILVDGKEITNEQLAQIPKTTIESVHTFKGAPAVERYGVKGKDGVIVITTRQ